MHRTFHTIFPIMFLTMISGCSMKEYRLFQQENEPPVTVVSDEEYKDEMRFENKIVPGDRVEIQVYNQLGGGSEMTSMVNTRSSEQSVDEGIGLLVTANGTLRLPLIGVQKVVGMTEDEAADFLMTKYQKYLRNPYVTVEITNQRVFVLGEVMHPGVVQVTNGTMNLVEAIARTGDMTNYADRTRIKVLRGDLRNPEVRVIDLTEMSTIRVSSLFLRPNDIVYIEPRAIKGYNITMEQLSPPFQFVATLLQPFVNITFMVKTLGG